MPYKSNNQRRFFHTKAVEEEGIKKKTTEKSDKENKGVDLPEKVNEEDEKEKTAAEGSKT